MTNTKPVRTRFAPSPTGFLHIGGARTALFNYLYAKSQKGKFILRVEDTDRSRSTEESFKIILNSLKWLNINWDEGPEVGGEYGPYIQSKRINIYQKYTKQLLEEKKAYRCFCSQEQLEQKKKLAETMGVPYVYDRVCFGMSEKEIERKIEEKVPFAIRFFVEPKNLIIYDLIQSNVKFDTKLIGDFIIVKSDGFPSYNYAVVIDDYLMEISHIIRGVGHLSNTPRQVLLYEAFNFELPKFAHVSEIVGMDGKKISKRAGATSVMEFQNLGYLPESFINYMALLGWSPVDGKEYLPNNKIEQIFDINKCSKSPAMFDFLKKPKNEDKNQIQAFTPEDLEKNLNPKSKLNWLSNKYIRDANIKQIAKAILPIIKTRKDIPESIKFEDNKDLLSILDSIRVYLDRLNQAPDYIAEFFIENLDFESKEAKDYFLEGKEIVDSFKKSLENNNPKNDEDFKEIMKKIGENHDKKGKALFMPIRVATTGKTHGLELPILFPLLSKNKLLIRIEQLLNKI